MQPPRRLLGVAAATLDRAVLAGMRFRSRGSVAQRISHAERMQALVSARDAYAAPELWHGPDAFFTPPPSVTPELSLVRETIDGLSVFDVAWPSRWNPMPPTAPNGDVGAAGEENRTARARLFLAQAARPAMILIHGYLGGDWAFEELAWPIDWLSRSFDVAIAVLPFHGLRASARHRGTPPFPGPDPRVTNEGFRQAISDLRALIGILRARGAPCVGVMGKSLGGYTASLLATIEPNLAFTVPIIPLASIADFAREQGRLGTGDEARAERDAMEEANWIVSPFARPSLCAPERVLVVAAKWDNITPIAHAERLAAHFGAKIVLFEGGHLEFGRAEAYRAIGSWLNGLATSAQRLLE